VERSLETQVRQHLTAAAADWGVDLAPAVPRLAAFSELLLSWRARVNLTGAQSLEELCAEHIADAFPLARLLPATGSWIDVGSGAGLPGLILAVVRPDLGGVLLEPREKRRAFLRAAVRGLGISAVEVVGGRLEERSADWAGRYDFAVSRAVFELGDWLERGLTLVRAGGLVAGFGTEASVSASAPRGAEVIGYDVGAGPRAVVSVRK
jgi:16S rRNA (guanine527-N7)-methyltransferase